MGAAVQESLIENRQVARLVAILDQDHEQHTVARRWFKREAHLGWATCPITENGCLRVMSHTAYPNRPGGPETVRLLLESLIAQPGHQFLPDNISLVAGSDDAASLEAVTTAQLTDTYLYRLACRHDGILVTLDRRIAGAAEQLRLLKS